MIDFDRVLSLRALYRQRGPLDGASGVTPAGLMEPAIRHRLEPTLREAEEKARETLAKEPGHPGHDATCVCPTSTDPPHRSEPCPARGPGLTHTQDFRWRTDGSCIHCFAPLSLSFDPPP